MASTREGSQSKRVGRQIQEQTPSCCLCLVSFTAADGSVNRCLHSIFMIDSISQTAVILKAWFTHSISFVFPLPFYIAYYASVELLPEFLWLHNLTLLWHPSPFSRCPCFEAHASAQCVSAWLWKKCFLEQEKNYTCRFGSTFLLLLKGLMLMPYKKKINPVVFYSFPT